MATLRKSSLIKRYTYPLCRRSVVTNTPTQENPFADETVSYEFNREGALTCTIQSMSDWALQNMPEGVRNAEMYTIFSNTALYGAIENTNQLADAIYLPDSYFTLNSVSIGVNLGGWFYIYKSKLRNSGIINHTEAVMIRDNNLTSTEGFSQYPTTTILAPLIDTRDKLLGGAWLTSWEGENI